MVEMSTLSHHAGGVVHVSTLHLVLSMAPLLFVIAASWKMELGLGSAIVTGAFRTLVQLSILGVVLQPIFKGVRNLAFREDSDESRCKGHCQLIRLFSRDGW